MADAEERCRFLNAQMPLGGLYTGEERPTHPESNAPWRISPEPFWITPTEYEWFETLGSHLLSFYKACNLLYSQSVRGIQPPWIAEALDQGKHADIIAYGRMNRFKSQLPLVLRPDVLPTEEGMIITELDAVPGGIGFTGFLSRLYAQLGDPIVGGSEGMVCGFAEMLRSLSGKPHPITAIVVSDESENYRAEMTWLAAALREVCLPAFALHPREVRFDDTLGLFAELNGERHVFDVLYRFFELFDLPNIPKAELMLYAAKKRLVHMTPPPKAYLEEKMTFAFFHHPTLEPFWKQNLPPDTWQLLQKTLPRTWLLDGTPIPPQAIIPGLTHRGIPVQDFRQLTDATQKEREFVLKPSGYSPLAWGSRGVVVGHDVSQEIWRQTLTHALEQFSHSPYILQEFHKGRRYRLGYYDFHRKCVADMEGRVRLTPYYFLINEKIKLGGILATVCPADKKVLHGMVDSVIAPCAVFR